MAPRGDGRRPKRYKTPRTLARMRRLFTPDRQLAEFRRVFGRDPADEAELDLFVKEFTRELYNSGYDEVPP